MAIDKYYEQFNECRQKEEPACTNSCPFHLDVLAFQDKMHRQKYDRAYRDYRNAVAFPEIVSALCPEYCHNACPRKDFDGAVQLNLLEKTCVAKAKRKAPTSYNVPPKKGKVGIIGAGISGLACALKLLEKKYEVILFEKSNVIGGQLKDLLPEEVYLADIDRQMGKEKYEIHMNTELCSLEELAEYGFDSVYVATGKGGNDFHTLETGGTPCYLADEVAVFGGGSLAGKDVVQSIADGLDMAWAIEIFLQTGKLEYPGKRPDTKVVADTDEFKECSPVIPTEESQSVSGTKIFTDEETEKEAGRCIRCQCNACWKKCDMVAYLEQWPLSMKEEVAMTVMSTESMIHKNPAIRLINICTQCGLFEEVCPPHIEMNNMMLDARKLLHKQGKMPPAFHGFWLDDMKHANSSDSMICRNAPGSSNSSYAFFPGCHLGAADPRYVKESYNWLQNNFDDMGLMLRCCGVPADWAGNEEMHDEQIKTIRNEWLELGSPILVMACPSCTRHIKKYLPEIDTISIYELMKENDKWPEKPENSFCVNNVFDADNDFALFDPCAARNDEGIKNAVRTGINHMVIKYSELPTDGNNACCGFGGNVEVADPGFAKYVAEQRTRLSEKPYITYCANCRDIFLDEGKPAIHMLDVLFGTNGSDVDTPNLTERRANRKNLKKNLLRQYWGEEMKENEKPYSFAIEIPDDLKKKMDRLKLVEDDIYEVIEKSNRINRRTYDKDANEYICYARLNYITCWVRYKLSDNTYLIKNIYTHRMDIKLEGVFNGRKIDTDL